MRISTPLRFTFAWLVPHIATSAPPEASTEEPSIVSILPISTGTPIEMSSTATNRPLMVRQWDWAPSAASWSAPPVQTWVSPPIWTPSPQPWTPTPVHTIIVTKTPGPTGISTPTPSYTWTETHNDSTNTKIHGIIAAIAIGAVFAAGIVGAVVTLCIRKCCSCSSRKHKSSRDAEEGDVVDCSDSVTNPSLNGHATQPREFLAFDQETGVQLASSQVPSSMAYGSRG